MGLDGRSHAGRSGAASSSGLRRAGWLFWHGITTHIKARYTLLLDNLFDLTHVAYVHASVFNFPEGEDPPGFDAPLSLRVEGDHLFAARPLCGVPYDDYATLQFGPGQGTMDLDSPSDYHGPALIVTGTVHRLHDEKAGSLAIMHPDGQRGGALRVFHGVTPGDPLLDALLLRVLA